MKFISFYTSDTVESDGGNEMEEQFVGNKANGRISKWVFQENKAGKIFQNFFLTP